MSTTSPGPTDGSSLEGRGRARALVTEHGWDAHLQAHAVFAEHLVGCYSSVKSPLVLVLRAEALRQDLRRHMELEDSIVLPLYEQRVQAPRPPGKAEHFFSDHRLLRRRLEELLDLCLRAELEPMPTSLLRHAVHAVDDLLDHHDYRERVHLYPALHDALAPRERDDLLETLACVELRGDGDLPEVIPEIIQALPVQELLERARAWHRFRDRAPEARHALEMATALPVLESLKEYPGIPAEASLLARRAIELTLAHDPDSRDDPRQFARSEERADQGWRSAIAYVLAESLASA